MGLRRLRLLRLIRRVGFGFGKEPRTPKSEEPSLRDAIFGWGVGKALDYLFDTNKNKNNNGVITANRGQIELDKNPGSVAPGPGGVHPDPNYDAYDNCGCDSWFN